MAKAMTDAKVELVAEALSDDLSFQLADGKGAIDVAGGPAFTSVSGEIDLERLARAAFAALEQSDAVLPQEDLGDDRTT